MVIYSKIGRGLKAPIPTSRSPFPNLPAANKRSDVQIKFLYYHLYIYIHISISIPTYIYIYIYNHLVTLDMCFIMLYLKIEFTYRK